MIKSILFIIFTALCFFIAPAQNLSFTSPQNLVPDAVSDKAMSLANFNRHYLAAWKDTGAVGSINVSYLGQKHGSDFLQKQSGIKGATSSFAPVLLASDAHIYLFWIGTDGNVRYVINTSETGFEDAEIHTLKINGPLIFTMGISAAVVDQKIIIAAHSNAKNRLMLILSSVSENGLLKDADIIKVKAARSSSHPVVMGINSGSVARVSWVDHKSQEIYYADYTPANNSWLPPQSFSGAVSDIPPALYATTSSQYLIAIWKGKKKDPRLRYIEASDEEMPEEGTVLPEYFSTDHAVSITGLDDNNFMMAYTGTDRKLYFSYCANYNPASWMGDLLLLSRKNYSLKDIVIPGAHDAGMSVLSGVGGKGQKTINECNTLTQVQNIEKQLNAGIRMFDLRIDQYQGELFTKHAPSDCMDDAIAGGYGEKLKAVLDAIKHFLNANKQEFVILSFCHFCEKNISLADQAAAITNAIGKDKIFYADGKKLEEIKLKDLAGKALITFENRAFPELGVDSNTMTEAASGAFINYRREYAATNQLNKLLTAQRSFFTKLKGNVKANDLIRLDWQLTEASQEAVFICNDFESEKSNPLVDGAILLANTLKKNKSIRDLSFLGGRHLPVKIVEWIKDGTINAENKPNILYVDVAGTWITDFCIELNKEKIYQK